MREFAVVDHILKERELEGVEFTPLQKELIFKEISFRLKNNLNTIASLFGLQIINAEENRNKEVSRVLLTNKVRINTISILHDSLYKDSAKLQSFADHIKNIINLINDGLSEVPLILLDFDDIGLSPDSTIKLGTIFCELYTNSLQHAFGKVDHFGEIVVSFKCVDDKIVFTYYEKNHRGVDIEKMLKSKTVGMKLVMINSRQLNAKLDIFHKEGLLFRLTM